MSAVLKIIDQNPGAGSRPVPDLKLVRERITATELICRRVEAEVKTWNASKDNLFQGLIQPTDSRRLMDGYRLDRRRKLDPDKQTQIALEAFANNQFVLLFDDRQIDDADELLVIKPDSTATFVKLVPLVGG